jgi:hypothetical protein
MDEGKRELGHEQSGVMCECKTCPHFQGGFAVSHFLNRNGDFGRDTDTSDDTNGGVT